MATDLYQALGSLTVSTSLRCQNVFEEKKNKTNISPPGVWEGLRNLPPVLKARNIANSTEVKGELIAEHCLV